MCPNCFLKTWFISEGKNRFFDWKNRQWLFSKYYIFYSPFCIHFSIHQSFGQHKPFLRHHTFFVILFSKFVFFYELILNLMLTFIRSPKFGFLNQCISFWFFAHLFLRTFFAHMFLRVLILCALMFAHFCSFFLAHIFLVRIYFCALFFK